MSGLYYAVDRALRIADTRTNGVTGTENLLLGALSLDEDMGVRVCARYAVTYGSTAETWWGIWKSMYEEPAEPVATVTIPSWAGKYTVAAAQVLSSVTRADGTVDEWGVPRLLLALLERHDLAHIIVGQTLRARNFEEEPALAAMIAGLRQVLS